MPLIEIEWCAGESCQAKNSIRQGVKNGIGALMGVDPDFVAVSFHDLPELQTKTQTAIVFVYITEGRPVLFKEKIVTVITENIVSYTAYRSDGVVVLIYDLSLGSVAVRGKIVNRNGPAAESVIKEKAEISFSERKQECPCQ